MFAPRAFWSTRRSAGLWSGLGPPAFTAIAMSLLMRVKAFAIRFHRANIVALRVSKMRPMRSRSRAGGSGARRPRLSHRRRRRASPSGTEEGVEEGAAFAEGAPAVAHEHMGDRRVEGAEAAKGREGLVRIPQLLGREEHERAGAVRPDEVAEDGGLVLEHQG